MAGLQERAERAFRDACPADLRGRLMRTALDATDGTLIVFLSLTSDAVESNAADPFRLLYRNARPAVAADPEPAVLDAEEGRPAARMVVPYKLWADAQRLKAFWEQAGSPAGQEAAGSELRLLKGIPDEVQEHRYGRSGRLALLFGRRQPLLCVRVFPGGFAPFGEDVPAERLNRAAWLLLARSGAAPKPYPFHLLRRSGILQVERAAALPAIAARGTLKAFEHELIRGAEEDRVLLSALFQSGAPWELQKSTDAQGRI